MVENNNSGLNKFKKRQILYLALYIILFYAAWTFKEGFLTKFVGNNESISMNARYMISGGIKILLWVFPVFLYLKYIDRKSPLNYLKMNRNVIKGLLWGVAVCAAYIGFNFLKGYVTGSLKLNLNLGLDKWLNTIILAGITEEIVFRGFLLQKLEQFCGYWLIWLTEKKFFQRELFLKNKELSVFWGANILTSLLFVFIHFPRWYFNEGQILFQSMISVFILGIAFGYTYKKTGSIWTSVLFHSTNNFIVSALFN